MIRQRFAHLFRTSLLLLSAFLYCVPNVQAEADRPNVVWLTSEDNGPQLGCYGDPYADTPFLDKLASKGMRYLHCWSNAPVCAPARTTIISGVYPTSTGSQHMRSQTTLPSNMKMYPQYLREAGYYCTNNSKEDYNLEQPGQVWDNSSKKAHWRNRGKDQPFFAIFNETISHESKIRVRPHTLIHDPAKAPVPAYHPDTPEVRHDWAQYYDKMTEMDTKLSKRYDELDKAGVLDDTIIFYYGDHGSGMPRSKRWPYNSGLSVPLIVIIPEKYQHLAPKNYEAGGVSDRLVSFIDLAPTLLSITGLEIPKHMDGHTFLGEKDIPREDYIYGFRGRMDERYDLVRTIRDQRYIYIRNFMPHKIQGQRLDYMFQTPTTQVWHKMFHEGKLNDVQSFFWKPKPSEELYDLEADPDEVVNLADRHEFQGKKKQFKEALTNHIIKTRDVGFIPEAEIHLRSKGMTPYEMGHNQDLYNILEVLPVAELATTRDNSEFGMKLLDMARKDQDSVIRYWSILGLIIRGSEAVQPRTEELHTFLKDPSDIVKVAAAEALGRYGSVEDRQTACEALLPLSNIQTQGVHMAMLALNAMDTIEIDTRKKYKEQIEALPKQGGKDVPRRMRSYVDRLLTDAVEALNEN